MSSAAPAALAVMAMLAKDGSDAPPLEKAAARRL
jgi:hypothetical protein